MIKCTEILVTLISTERATFITTSSPSTLIFTIYSHYERGAFAHLASENISVFICKKVISSKLIPNTPLHCHNV